MRTVSAVFAVRHFASLVELPAVFHGSETGFPLEALDEEGFHLVKVPFRPTAENFSEYFFRKMEEKGYPVKRAVVYETPNNCAAYRETEEETEAVWL